MYSKWCAADDDVKLEPEKIKSLEYQFPALTETIQVNKAVVLHFLSSSLPSSLSLSLSLSLSPFLHLPLSLPLDIISRGSIVWWYI